MEKPGNVENHRREHPVCKTLQSFVEFLKKTLVTLLVKEP